MTNLNLTPHVEYVDTPLPLAVVPHGYRMPALYVSDSSMGVARRCMRKFELMKLYGHLRNDDGGSLAAEVGHALHQGYQNYCKTRNKDEAIWAMISRYPSLLCNSPNDARSMEACYSTLDEMFDHPINARYKIAYVNVNGVERAAIEVPFRIKLNGVNLFDGYEIPIYYDGFIDIILYDTVEQKFIVTDIKTTRIKRNDYTMMWCNDPQCLPYAYIIEMALGQPADFLDIKYLVAYIDALDPKVLTYEFTKTAEDIADWGFNFASDIMRIKNFASLGHFPKNGKACDDWGACQYAQVCGYKHPEQIIQYLDLQFGLPVWEKPDFIPWFELDLTIQGLQ